MVFLFFYLDSKILTRAPQRQHARGYYTQTLRAQNRADSTVTDVVCDVDVVHPSTGVSNYEPDQGRSRRSGPRKLVPDTGDRPTPITSRSLYRRSWSDEYVISTLVS